MDNKNKVVLGIFNSYSQLENAVDHLVAEGFRHADISALLPSNESTKEFAHSKQTKLPEGAAAGSTAGMAVGGVLGYLAGAGTIALGPGMFLAAGPLMAMLGGAGAGAAVGGLTGALIGLGIPEYEANRYDGMVKSGGHLLSVHCDNSEWVDRAKNILRQNGAHDVSSTSEAAGDSAQPVREDIPKNTPTPGH